MHLFYAILVDRNVGEKPFFLNRCLRIAPQEGSYLMKNIRLHHPFSNNMTAVSNYFIDYYMPQAGGEYVKLYLCLLRHAADYGSIPLESIAELFDYTERDIYRGLQYWADQGLIDLAFDQDGSISDLVFLEVRKPESVQQAAASVSSGVLPASVKAPVSKNTTKKVASEPNDSTEAKVLSPKLKISRDRMAVLQGEQDIKQLLLIAESYLGHSLSPTEMSSILYYYDSLHFNFELIEYLIEYCISRGTKSFHYIDKVALAWAEEGITNAGQAKERQSQYSQKYYSVLNAFGIRDRGPGKPEVQMIDHWFDDLHFTSDIILEACSRTLTQTQNPSFQYANKILESWHASGIHHLNEIRELDQKHQKTGKAASKQRPAVTSGSKFNNFSQRDYDFDHLESLLNQ